MPTPRVASHEGTAAFARFGRARTEKMTVR
jgi:hypothetical protein